MRGVNLQTLPIGPVEAFVFSRVDERSNVKEISHATGLHPTEVEAALHKLASLGAIAPKNAPYTNGENRRALTPQSPHPQRASLQPNGFRNGKNDTKNEEPTSTIDTDTRQATRQGQQNKSTASVLDESTRQQVDNLLHLSKQGDYYQLLDLPRSAEKKAIKQSYYAAIARLHPDRFFGSDLGTYKAKVEHVVSLLTRAHDTLTRKKLRASYDAGLGPVSPPVDGKASDSTALDATKTQTEAELDASGPAKLAKEERPMRQGGAPSADDRSGASPAPLVDRLSHRQPAMQGNKDQRLSSVPAANRSGEGARRKALARKLRASRRPVTRSSAAGDVSPGRSSSHSSDSRPQQLVTPDNAHAAPTKPVAQQEPGAQARHYADRAQASLDEGNPTAAANSLRLALTLSPHDPDLKKRLDAAELLVDKLNVSKHLAQAREARSQGDFRHAARYFSRAASGKSLHPDAQVESAELYLEAAECVRASGQPLKLAREYAKRAVSLNPQGAREHLALGQIYAEAGMQSSALGQLEQAHQLHPNDANIAAWLKRVRQGDV